MAERNKGKAVNVRMIDAKKEPEPYRILSQLITGYRDDLRECRIALMWHENWRPDADGNEQFAKTTLRHERERELSRYDVVIEINREHWAAQADGHVRHAMLHHALCIVERSIDRNGEPKSDDKGRAVYRKRKPDIQGFTETARLFGPHHTKLADYAAALKATPSYAPDRKALPARKARNKPVAKQADA